jgi:outer membrane receptor for ferrienterochelin and colicins
MQVGLRSFLIGLFSFCSVVSLAQAGSVKGIVLSDNKPLQFVTIQISGTSLGDISNSTGSFLINDIPYGNYKLTASAMGFESVSKSFVVNAQEPESTINFDLKESQLMLDKFVVTGTKTFKRQTESAVIVNVIDSRTLENVQACNLSEGLKFQPGLRVETDCQTCNYTQLRMNGLAGGYSQILINGRPIFSPLTGLYGLEQIPANMIERIEVVRGGGSALYGSSAIGGTVNVITKIPTESNFDIGFTHQNINGGAQDNIFSGNGTVLSHKKNAGATFFVNNRSRDYYDHNGDNYSELPELKNNSFGTNMFFQPTKNQKLEVSLSNLTEYRYGGEMVDKPAYLTQQSEERTHRVWIGSIDYQWNFNNDSSSLIAYAAGQNTERDHYTGITPDDSIGYQHHLENPPYGYSDNTTWQGGIQMNHKIRSFTGHSNVLTFGGEFVSDDVVDKIESYNYLVDQQTENLGVFFQSDWELTQSLNLLAGARADKHNLVDHVIVSPRVSLLYKLKTATQFRLTWGSGFRAPQAFDTDLHIAFAGGGVSRVSLASDLKEERSQSLSASVNYDLSKEKYVVGFTFEGFYTYLKDAFFLQPLGTDEFGQRFEKQNGDGATVQGVTIELRGNYNRKIQLETGLTIQESLFDNPVEYAVDLPARKDFLRTPNVYGYGTLSFTPNKKLNASINMVYTGTMDLVHFAGAPEITEDTYVTADSFMELGGKIGYTFGLKKMDTGLEVFGGIKNIFNAYQSDFDTGKNRDSNYIYGPGMPRTFFVGIRIKSF